MLSFHCRVCLAGKTMANCTHAFIFTRRILKSLFSRVSIQSIMCPQTIMLLLFRWTLSLELPACALSYWFFSYMHSSCKLQEIRTLSPTEVKVWTKTHRSSFMAKPSGWTSAWILSTSLCPLRALEEEAGSGYLYWLVSTQLKPWGIGMEEMSLTNSSPQKARACS